MQDLLQYEFDLFKLCCVFCSWSENVRVVNIKKIFGGL